MAQQQTFENHAKVVPAYHYFTFGLIAVYFFYRLYIAVTAFSLDALMSLLLVVALLMVFFWARLFALRVQDRVIRLEMRLRLLRDTRMPAIVVELGPPPLAVEHGAPVAAAVADAITRWATEPVA